VGHQCVYVGFSTHKIPRSSAYTISKKAIWFRHPDYDLDRAQKLLQLSRHLSTRNISSKSRHTFLSNLVNRPTDRQTRAKTLPPLSEVIIIMRKFHHPVVESEIIVCSVTLQHRDGRSSSDCCVAGEHELISIYMLMMTVWSCLLHQQPT